LDRNQFDGDFPTFIFSLPNLQVLNVARNQLKGSLAEEVASLVNLKILDLSSNFFGGSIPDSIGEMTSLVELRLNTNAVPNGPFFGFSGSIPTTIGLLDNLVRFDVFENLLTGVLPTELGYLDKLEILDVALNTNLTGSIPAQFESLAGLRELYIGGTNIAGTVPSGLCQMQIYLEISCGDGATAPTCDCCTCGTDV
jgi:Leucine-rich repeat (LRR) protein